MTRPTKVWVGRGGRIRKSYRESVVKKNILEYLLRRGVFAWNNPRGGAWTQKGGKSGENYDAKGSFLRYGGPKGASDIIGILPGGRFLAIETKRTHGGKASEEQIRFIDEVNRRGGLGFFAKNLDEAIEALKPVIGGW